MSASSAAFSPACAAAFNPVWGAAQGLASRVKALYRSGEQGAWYDPSDLATLYQDSAGTVPVTAVGQPVGLMLDKRLGLVRGVEKVTNGDNESALFSAGALTTGSAVVTRAASPSGAGFAALATSTTSSSVPHQVNSASTFIPAGQNVEISVDVYVPTGGVGVMRMFDNSDGSWFGQNTTLKDQWVTLRSYRPAKASAWSLGMGNHLGDVVASGAPAFYVDNLSIRELPGNHAVQPTAINRPVLQARVNLLVKSEQFDDGAWVTGKTAGATVAPNATIAPDGTLTADTVTFATAGDYLYSPTGVIAVSVGDKYTATLFAKTAIQVFTFGGGGVAGTLAYTAADVGNGWFRQQVVKTFTATGSAVIQILPIGQWVGAGSYPIWGAQLETGPTATRYQRINTSTDYDTVGFPSYLAFNGTNSWMQTGSMDFTGTDKMTVVAGVRKLSDAGGFPVLLELGASPRTLSIYQNAGTGKDKYTTSLFGVQDSWGEAGPTLPAPATSVVAVNGNITAPSRVLAIRQRINQIDYALTGGTDVPPNGANFGNYPLYIGARAGASLFFNGNLYSLIIRGALSSNAQITSAETFVNSKTGAY